MYWRKLFDRENPNEKLEQKILDIRKKNKDFGEKVCVPCAVNRNGLSISKITNTGHGERSLFQNVTAR